MSKRKVCEMCGKPVLKKDGYRQEASKAYHYECLRLNPEVRP